MYLRKRERERGVIVLLLALSARTDLTSGRRFPATIIYVVLFRCIDRSKPPARLRIYELNRTRTVRKPLESLSRESRFERIESDEFLDLPLAPRGIAQMRKRCIERNGIFCPTRGKWKRKQTHKLLGTTLMRLLLHVP